MINGSRVATWTCVNFSTRIDRNLPQEFCRQLIDMCVSKGMVCLVSASGYLFVFIPERLLTVLYILPAIQSATCYSVRLLPASKN